MKIIEHGVLDYEYRQQRRLRRRQRYFRLASKLLPEKAPSALVEELSGIFMGISCAAVATQLRKYPNHLTEIGCNSSNCFHCSLGLQFTRIEGDDYIGLLGRLATYPDMEFVWATLQNHPRVTSELSTDICEALIREIRWAVYPFGSTIQRSASERRKGTGLVARLAKELAKAINDDGDANQHAQGFFGAYIGLRNLDFRKKDGRPSILSHRPQDSYIPDRLDLTYEDELEIMPWAEWPMADKYQWVCDEIQHASISAVLLSFARDLEQIAQTKPEIPRPGRGDSQYRHLVNRLAAFMLRQFGAPLDDAVAKVVSVVLDRETPLTRDDIKRHRKRAGNIASDVLDAGLP